MSSNNTPALVSAIAAAALVVSFFIGVCIGFIPFIGLIALLLYPLDWILALVAIVAGIMGLRGVKETGEGQFESIIGMVVGAGFILLQLIMFGLMFALGGFGFIMTKLTEMGVLN